MNVCSFQLRVRGHRPVRWSWIILVTPNFPREFKETEGINVNMKWSHTSDTSSLSAAAPEKNFSWELTKMRFKVFGPSAEQKVVVTTSGMFSSNCRHAAHQMAPQIRHHLYTGECSKARTTRTERTPLSRPGPASAPGRVGLQLPVAVCSLWELGWKPEGMLGIKRSGWRQTQSCCDLSWGLTSSWGADVIKKMILVSPLKWAVVRWLQRDK